ncbi:hypothetical protein BC628DRAFT_1309294 [Trametes gibbosa]|nr:hypothetical protein BC628DRAFT_1309294 [Trametes gibbosa]
MKFSSILLPSLLCAASASAQYFSAGWVPGQGPNLVPDAPAPTGNTPTPGQTFDRAETPAPAPPASGGSGGVLGGIASLLDLNRLLTAGPVASLFEKLGMNVTEAVGRATASPWDLRIPFITDENFEDVIVNEELTPEEEKERVWILIISVTAGGNNAISQFVDKSFDEAYNQTLIAGDLPHVRWGRIDYINVTYITTKWSVWSGPYIVLLKDRGQSLRFYKADRVRITPELLRELLIEELWRNSSVWSSNFAPGGKREWILHYYALGLTHVFNFVNRFPRWMLMIASGAIASLVMRILHRNPTAAVPPKAEEPKPIASESTGSETAVASSTATASPSKGKGKQRKNKK